MNTDANVQLVSSDEAHDYLAEATFCRFLLGLGVFFCIVAPIGPIMGSALENTFGGAFSGLFEGMGVVFLLISVALGVGLIILSSAKKKEWKYLRRGHCILDDEAEDYVKSELSSCSTSKSTMLALGIVLCVLSVVPVTFFGIFNIFPLLTEGIGPSLIFVIVGVGVFFILNSSRTTNPCEKLLQLNGR